MSVAGEETEKTNAEASLPAGKTWRTTLIVALLLAALGALVPMLREKMWKSRTWRTFSKAEIVVNESQDGFSADFGAVQVAEKDRAAVRDLFQDCLHRREEMLAFFRRALTEGNTTARVLACRSAFFLWPEKNKPGLTVADLNLIAACLGPAKSAAAGETGSATKTKNPEEQKADEAQRVAQWAFSQLLLVRGEQAEKTFGMLPASAKNAAAPEEVKLSAVGTEGEGEKTWRPAWNSPLTCAAWWRAYGKLARWDAVRRHFVLPAPPSLAYRRKGGSQITPTPIALRK